MNKFLEIYNLPRLNQGEIENVKTSTTSNEIKSAIKKKTTFNKQKIQDQMASHKNSIKYLEKS